MGGASLGAALGAHLGGVPMAHLPPEEQARLFQEFNARVAVRLAEPSGCPPAFSLPPSSGGGSASFCVPQQRSPGMRPA